MREIKFRGLTFDGKFVYGSLIKKRFTAFAEWMVEDENGLGSDVITETIGQFTGLKDKNGNEIYEGDINKSGLAVKWSQLICRFGLFSQTGWYEEIWADYFLSESEPTREWKTSFIEIIGNIHENPELKK